MAYQSLPPAHSTIRSLLALSLFAAACGSGSIPSPSSARQTAAPPAAPVVASPVKHVDVNGSSIDVLLLDAVTAVTVTENGAPAAANVSTYTDDANGIHADPARALYWRLGVAFFHTYQVVVRYKGVDFTAGPYTPIPNVCGGCVDPPPAPAAPRVECSSNALAVVADWLEPRKATAADEESITVATRQGYIPFTVYLTSYGGAWPLAFPMTRQHGSDRIDVTSTPQTARIHLAHGLLPGWYVALTCEPPPDPLAAPPAVLSSTSGGS